MSRGDASEVFSADPITPKFQNTAPLIEQVLPPLTAEEEKAVDQMMIESPEYQNIMEMCRELKIETLNAAAEAVSIIGLIKDGTITKDNPELWDASIKLAIAASETAKSGRAALENINAEMKETGLPLGECAMKDDLAPQVVPPSSPAAAP